MTYNREIFLILMHPSGIMKERMEGDYMVLDFTRHDIVQQLECHLEKARQHHENRDFRDAIEEYFQALPLTKYTAQITLGQLKSSIAICYYALNDYQTAIRYFDQILTECLDDISDLDYIITKTRKGVSLGKLGHYNDAIQLFEEMIAMGLVEAELRAYINLGVLYFKLYKFSGRDCLGTALDYLKKALLLVDEKEKLRKHGILRNIGIIYYEQKKYLRALDFFTNALVLVKKPIHIARTYSEIAKTYIELLDFQSAIKYLNEVQDTMIRSKDFYSLAYSIMVRGLLYEKKDDINNAHNYFQTALFGFLEIQAYPEVVEIYYRLYKLFLNRDSSRAKVYHEHYKFYINYVDPLGE